jgi:DNA-binding response OmpR family regulator
MSQSLRILLIALDPELIRKIGQGLQRPGAGPLVIEGADSLSTARRRLDSGVYDLALLDLALDGGDSLRFLSDLLELAPDLPIVVLAGDAAAPDMATCIAHGARDRLSRGALDSAGLLDRLRAVAARAQAGQVFRRRSQHVAACLEAVGDLAWHYDHGEDEVWLAAADPGAWQLPDRESSESLDALRARIHPDDREIALRRIEELIETDQPWQLEARVKVGGGAYRWCALRGRSELDERGRLLRAAGVLSDAQRQQKALREVEQGRRFLRAIFDSDHMPRAILDASGLITECNPAWLALDEPACHAGKEFGPGRAFISPSDDGQGFGDLDTAELARGMRQVLGGVLEQFSCEYGSAARRWRISLCPLLNPGIAGALVRHEEITATRRAGIAAQARLATLEQDFQSMGGVMFRVDAEFRVLAANDEAQAFGRAPIVGRDVLRVLPRVHADAVGSALAAVSAGARSAVRDSRPVDGRVMRWLLTGTRDAAGNADGFLVHGVDVSDLAAQAQAQAPVREPAPAPSAVPLPAPAAAAGDEELRALRKELERDRQLLGSARKALFEATEESERLVLQLAEEQQCVAEEQQRVAEERKRHAELRRALAALESQRDELAAALEGVRREADEAQRREAEAERKEAEARRREAEAERAGRELAAALDGERARHGETLAALSAAAQAPAELRAQLSQAREGLRADIQQLVDRIFQPLLEERDPGSRPAEPGEDPRGTG